jgi:hypothetical protein
MIAPDGWYCRPLSVRAERSTTSACSAGSPRYTRPLLPEVDGALEAVGQIRRAGTVEADREAVDVAGADMADLVPAAQAVGDEAVTAGELAHEPAEPLRPLRRPALVEVGPRVAEDLHAHVAGQSLEPPAERLTCAHVEPVGQPDRARGGVEGGLHNVGLRQVAALG